jgi:hypothetical protein
MKRRFYLILLVLVLVVLAVPSFAAKATYRHREADDPA